MGKSKLKTLINTFKDNCFLYKYNIQNQNFYLRKISLSHSNVLEELLKLKKKDDEKYSSTIISTINKLMNFTLYTRDKYYGLESYEMFAVQFINYCDYYFKNLIHINNIELLLKCVVERRQNEENIGSYYDLKCLAKCIIYNTREPTHPILELIYACFSNQIKKDTQYMNQGRIQEISYCAKWIPREKSGSSWMVPYIVKNLYNLNHRKCTRPQYYSYLKKYRTNISHLNQYLDTPEIKMCANAWSEIDLSKTSSLFVKKYYKNFTQLRSEFDSDDRKQSMINFKNHMEQKVYYQMNKEDISDYIEKIYFTNYRSIDFENIMKTLTTHKERQVYNNLFINYCFNT